MVTGIALAERQQGVPCRRFSRHDQSATIARALTARFPETSMDTSLTPAQDLLADLTADLDDVAAILVPGGSAAFVDELAMLHPGAALHWLPADARQLPAPKGVVAHDDIADPGLPDRSIDLVAIEATGDRGLARRWLALARQAARPHGVVLVAGANDAGIKSVIGDARDAIGLSAVEDYRRRSRVAHIAVPPVPPAAPEWLEEPGIAPGTWARFAVSEGGVDLVFESLPGVFSADRLDEGTRLLLEHLDVPAGAAVLDVGGGAGVIGVVAGRRGAGSVTMTDVNLLAVAAAGRNAHLTETAVEVVARDVYDGVGERRFDLIVSNPPFHQGKVVDYDMTRRLIAEAGEHLKPGGRLVIVANAFLPYDRLMRERFGEVETLAATRQFRVLAATV
jgi:16S rRNA (guanine1207-N2)-methyltransferase